MNLSQDIHDAARSISEATPSTLVDVLNAFVAKFAGWPFSCARGTIVDGDGNRSAEMSAVVHTTPTRIEGPYAGAFPVDGVAAVIDANEFLNLEELRAAYGRIAQAKRLKKKPAPKLNGTPTTTVTLGLILWQRTELPMEVLAEEIDALNLETPARERPDMVVLSSTGTINYAVQMPGDSVSGDFLPPAEGALDAQIPPWYIVMVLRPAADYALNTMMGYLFAHLELFSPGARVPRWSEAVDGRPSRAVTSKGYQYNLRGELVPVPREFYSDRS